MHGASLRQAISLGFLVAFFAAQTAIAAPASRLYPALRNGEYMRARDVRIKVGGKPAFVYSLMHAGVTYGGIPTIASEFTSCELDEGPVDVELNYIGIPVNSIHVRRLGVDVPVRRVGDKILFLIDRAGAYVVEINRDLRNRGPVVVFANPPDRWAPRPGDISFPAGVITNAGVLHITRDHQRIHIPGGALVRGLFKIEGATGVEFSGNGIVLYDDEAAAEFGKVLDTSPILATDTRDLLLAGLTVVVAPTSFASGPGGGPEAPWAVHVLRSTNTRIVNLNVFNELRDGLDIDGSEQVTVQRGFVQAHDDVLCIKATNYGPGGGAQNRSVRKVTFRDIMVMNTGAGNVLAIGTELHAKEVADIAFRNIDILHAIGLHSTAMSVRNGDRAHVHDILFSDVRVLDQPGALLRLSVETDGYRPDPMRGNVDSVTFENIDASKYGASISTIEGIDPAHTIRDVVFRDFRPSPATNLIIKNAPEPQ